MEATDGTEGRIDLPELGNTLERYGVGRQCLRCGVRFENRDDYHKHMEDDHGIAHDTPGPRHGPGEDDDWDPHNIEDMAIRRTTRKKQWK